MKPAWEDFELPKQRTPPKPYPNPVIEGWDTETVETGEAKIMSNSKRSAVVDNLDDILFFLSCTQAKGKVNFWWNIDFDVTAMMKHDLDFLRELTDTNKARYGPYTVSYIPKKMLKVSRKGTSAAHYDAAQFYRQPLAKAAKTYLGKNAPDAKAQRDNLWVLPWQEIEDYCMWDATVTRDLGALYVQSLHKLGLYPRRFISNGNLAQQFILAHGDVPTFADQPKTVNQAAWLATRGALIDVWKRGSMKVWKYDLKSAYPAVMMQMPDFGNGKWSTRYDEHEWGIINASFTVTEKTPPIIPTFNGRHQLYPQWGRVEAWLCLAEFRAILPTIEDVEINVAHCFEPATDRRPWNDLLSRLMTMKEEAKDDPARYVAVKALINSFYGKTVQRVKQRGGGVVTGPLFNPVAGAITLGTARSQIADAIKGHMEDVAIIATDSIAFTKPVDHLDIGSNVGQWEVEGENRDAIIAHPGIYQVQGERTHTRGFKAVSVPDLWEACRYYGKNLQVSYDRPYTSREGLHHGRLEEVGRFLPHTYTVPIYNTRRLWRDRPKSYHDLLQGIYESDPIPSSIMEKW